jgi:dolichyl-phosphate beta-glucosyltransferase
MRVPVHLSIIIPAHNEEQRLPATLECVLTYLGGQPYTWDVWVVDSGSTDRTAAIATTLAEKHSQVHVVREARPGKGLAVRRGMLAAPGDFRFICDADLSMPIEQIARFLPPALEDVDIAIASREAEGAARFNEPFHRHLIGRVFNTLVRVLAVPHIQDTQCGFKCLSAGAAEDLFQRIQLEGWTFDVELLYLAQRRGFTIVEVPIDWTHIPGSRVHLLRDSAAMFLDLFRIRYNGLRGVYDRPLLEDTEA